ncbi:MAG: hypothetical protein P4L92_00870 [Rudaea sp.]|nr:hypothetical protein [Rudaea sp.]
MSHRISAFALGIAVLATPFATPAATLPQFTQPNAVWNEDVSNAPLRTNSAAMMTRLETIAASRTGAGKWGGDPNPSNPSAPSNVDFQIDMSDFYVLHANNSTPTEAVVAWPDAGDYYSPDCQNPGPQFQFPVPVVGGIEGTSPPAYSCNANDNDCHLLVSNDATNVLYEAYNTSSANASGVQARCALTWDLTKVYPRYGRGEHCTSADGAGFPMAPLMLNADEVWAAAQSGGDIGHAIRFILGNSRMAQGTHVHPSSHGTSATSDTNANAVPYGSHLRLKSTFDASSFSTNPAVLAIVRSLQNYGMFLSDGGTIPLSADTDTYTTHKWSDADMNMDSHSLFGINPTDFDVVDAGDPITDSGNCTLTPADFIFIDGYDY